MTPDLFLSPDIPATFGEKIHPFHKYGNMQILSRDGVTLYTDSRRLSEVSRELKAWVDVAEKDDSGHLQWDAEQYWVAETLSLLLDMINVEKPKIPEADIVNLCKLYDFCCDYDVGDKLKELVNKGIDEEIKDNDQQWALLVFAGQLEWDSNVRLSLANAALRNMTKDIFFNPEIYNAESKKYKPVYFAEALAELPGNWQEDLFQIIISLNKLEDDNRDDNAIYWKQVADKFQPECY